MLFNWFKNRKMRKAAQNETPGDQGSHFPDTVIEDTIIPDIPIEGHGPVHVRRNFPVAEQNRTKSQRTQSPTVTRPAPDRRNNRDTDDHLPAFFVPNTTPNVFDPRPHLKQSDNQDDRFQSKLGGDFGGAGATGDWDDRKTTPDNRNDTPDDNGRDSGGYDSNSSSSSGSGGDCTADANQDIIARHIARSARARTRFPE